MASYDLDKFFDMSPDFCWIGSAEGNVVHLSSAMRRALGWGAAIDDAKGFLELLHKADVPTAQQALSTIPNGPQSLEFDARLRLVDGSYRSVRWMGMRDAETGRIFVRGRMVEESERQQAVLVAEGRYFRGLIEYSEDIILVTGHKGELRYLSPAFERVLGFRAQGWLGENMLSLVWPEDQHQALKIFQQSVEQPGVMIPWRLRICHAEGGFRWLDGSATNQFQDLSVAGIVTNARDVTSHVNALQALQKSEFLLEEAQRIGRVASFDLDLATDEVHHSKVLLDFSQELSGRTMEQRPRDWRERIMDTGYTPDSERLALTAIEQSIQIGTPIDIELERNARGETWHWLHIRAAVVRDEQGKPTHVRGIVQDITTRKRAEQLLQLKERAIATSLNGVAITDANGQIVYVNPAFLRLWGYENEEAVLGRTPLELADPERTVQIISELHLRGSWRGELVAQRADGSSFEVLLAANVLLNNKGELTHMMGAFLDITESKRLQAQFLQAQKMESVGRLAGGVAHDFNNMLTVISGYLELALMEFPETENLEHYLQEIQKASRSAASLTQQLLAFSRKQIIAPRVLDLNDVLAKMRPMLERVIGEDVQLVVLPGTDLGRVRMDVSQVEQVILNLAVNARDAMPDGGKLTLETVNVDLDATYSAHHVGVEPGRYVVLAVSDNGAGMSEEVRKQLFEPFFTTKEAGKGTGLGLAMVYGAVKQNGGNIEVYSELGRGTTFKLYWPRISDAVQEIKTTNQAMLPRGSETLVLVEDDARVRKVAKLMLERQGYTVHAFSNGPEALEGVAALAEPLHLLVTDVIMPEMNGQVLSERMLLLRPEIKVLFASGYTANVIVHHGILKDGVEFLAKPYTHAALAQRVRDLLDKGR